MAENSKIEWTDHTFNPWIGCTKLSPGCANCYAERDFDTRRHVAEWGPIGTRVVTSEENWKKPLRWNRQAAKEGRRYRVFCASLADVFEDWPGQVRHSSGVPLWLMHQPNGHPFAWGAGHVLDDPTSGVPLKLQNVRRRLFHLIDATPHLDWILVTKRPENIPTMTPAYYPGYIPEAGAMNQPGPRPNLWLLTSTENQETFDQRVHALLKCRDLAAVLGISAEPLLGPIDMRLEECWDSSDCYELCDRLDWVIAGGESGPGARPCHPDWVRSLRDQCTNAGVPFFFKQWGEWGNGVKTQMDYDKGATQFIPGSYHDYGDRWMSLRIGKKNAGRLLDGQEWSEFPTGESE